MNIPTNDKLELAKRLLMKNITQDGFVAEMEVEIGVAVDALVDGITKEVLRIVGEQTRRVPRGDLAVADYQDEQRENARLRTALNNLEKYLTNCNYGQDHPWRVEIREALTAASEGDGSGVPVAVMDVIQVDPQMTQFKGRFGRVVEVRPEIQEFTALFHSLNGENIRVSFKFTDIGRVVQRVGHAAWGR